MYENLWDADRQQQIRESNPDVKHCRFLLDSPLACESLPGSAGDNAGSICPNNPYQRHAGEYARLRETGNLLNEALRIGDLAAFGALPKTSELSPEEFQIARIMRQHDQRHRVVEEQQSG